MGRMDFSRGKTKLDDIPVNEEYDEGVTSNWAHDHKADPSAHHAKTTDLAEITTGWDKQSFANLLTNGDFEVGDPPTGWILLGGGATVSRSAVQAKINSYSALLTRVGADCSYYQGVTDFIRYRNRTVIFGCWVYATVANRARLVISDGVWESWSTYHSGVAGWEWLTISRLIAAGAVQLNAGGQVLTGNTAAYFDGAILVEGDSCPAFSPKPQRLSEKGQLSGYAELDASGDVPDAQIPNLAASKITSGRFPVDRLPAMTDEKIWKGTGANIEEVPKPFRADGSQSLVNLLENGDFEVGDPPTGWTGYGGGATHSRSDTQAKIRTYSQKTIGAVGVNSGMYQDIANPTYYQGKKVTMGCWVYATGADRANILVNDSESGNVSPFHSGVAGWEWLTVTRTVDVAATYVRSNTRVNEDYTVYFDGAILVEGDSCPAFSPKPRSYDVRLGKGDLEWAANKLLKGAGAGSDPTEFDFGEQSFVNLLHNGDFEVGDPPDEWALLGAGATVSRSAVQKKVNSYSALLTRSVNNCYLRQSVTDYLRYAGRKVTLGGWVYATVADRAKLQIYDGTDQANSAYHSGVAGWEWLTCTYTVNATPAYLQTRLQVLTGDTSAYFDGAMLVEGDSCPAFSPKPIGTYDAITLRQALDANSQDINNVAAPGAAGDPLIKGTRVTADELPAVTDEHYLVGTGANMEERAVPTAGATLTVAETEVFSGTSPDPVAWTDLDLSGIVGANKALVLLKFLNASAGAKAVAFRPNGDTDESYTATVPYSGGCAGAKLLGSIFGYFIVATDAAGKVEWQFEGIGEVGITIDLVAYIK